MTDSLTSIADFTCLSAVYQAVLQGIACCAAAMAMMPQPTQGHQWPASKHTHVLVPLHLAFTCKHDHCLLTSACCNRRNPFMTSQRTNRQSLLCSAFSGEDCGHTPAFIMRSKSAGHINCMHGRVCSHVSANRMQGIAGSVSLLDA